MTDGPPNHLVDALTGFHGATITVRHPLPDASMRLLATLGAHVIIDPAAPPCTRFAGPYERALKPSGCRRCREIDRKAA